MLGAVAGDVIGSVYEANPIKTTDFPLFRPESVFTDDTVLTVAVAEALLTDRNYERRIRSFARRHPHAGYGGTFLQWMMTDGMGPYNSWGNGSAMRVSPVGWAFDRDDDVLSEARRTAEITHNHPEGIRGAEAVALAVFLARSGVDREDIRIRIAHRFEYDLRRTVDDIRPGYAFDVSCQGTVPEALIAFFDSSDFESAVRLAVSLGGDSDTLACISGAVAEAYYGGVPSSIEREVRQRIPAAFCDIIDRFRERFAA